ncbi:MAG: DUF2577 domain-containing protein [Clostridia bacterium]|nr:DUF2577 domain-containing protein [Clostridia bacterium]
MKNYAVTSGVPEVITGKILSLSPISIRTNQYTKLSSSEIVVPEHLSSRRVSVTVSGETYEAVAASPLSVGDSVFLLAEAGGELYYLLGII